MPRLVNIVGTRCRDGNHAALRRWYADHVHLLFAFDGLLEARLWQREGAADGAAPDYLCCYDFADAAAFADYEAGPVHAAAAADRQRGWGRDGIEITLRRAWRRLYRREDAGSTPQRRLVTAGDLAATDPDAALRRLVATHDASLEVYRAADAADATRVMLWTRDGGSASAEPIATDWSAPYQTLLHWQR